MGESSVLSLGHDALSVALMLAAPALIATTVVGLAVSVFQAVTQINEMTLTFVPKIVAVLVVLVAFGPWMTSTMVSFMARVFDGLPALVH